MAHETRLLNIDDQKTLLAAKRKMDDIGWAMKGINHMGNFIQTRMDLLPKKQQHWIQKITQNVLRGVVRANIRYMKKEAPKRAPMNKAYQAMVASSGALGGTFGPTVFALDLGVTTNLMMRTIMDIARAEGEDLSSLDTQLACIQVFGLGGSSRYDDDLDTGYYATRIALNAASKGATGKLMEGLMTTGASPFIKVIAAVASRFSVQVTEKFVAQVVPILGAAGGVAINVAFIRHFQNMAHAHFSIRRLERKYGQDKVQQAFEALS